MNEQPLSGCLVSCVCRCARFTSPTRRYSIVVCVRSLNVYIVVCDGGTGEVRENFRCPSPSGFVYVTCAFLAPNAAPFTDGTPNKLLLYNDEGGGCYSFGAFSYFAWQADSLKSSLSYLIWKVYNFMHSVSVVLFSSLNRTQYIQIGNPVANYISNLILRVPQGSLLGPLLIGV